MNIDKIPAGKNPPQDINVVIEITGGAAGGAPVKYEIDKDSGAVFVDRIVNTPMFYPCNYGFVPNTLHADGDPTDVLVLCDFPLAPGVVIRCRPVGVLKMEDDGGMDDKLIAVPVEKVDPFQAHVKELADIVPKTLERIKHFFEHYKDLEAGKWVRVIGWGDRAEAEIDPADLARRREALSRSPRRAGAGATRAGAAMHYETADDWRHAPHKRVALYGMSGLGKTHVSSMLRDNGDWFHYSVDFRIGTRYMGEHIVDNFKREAMRNPFLRELLRSDSIYIASNITFHNLAPLSTYLGKPGDPRRGGIAFDEYVARQRQHRAAEIAATRDAIEFIDKAETLYGYEHFVADTSGSICEVVDPCDPDDPILASFARSLLPVWIRGGAEHVEALAERFDRAPKPMYYPEDFLFRLWDEFGAERGVAPDAVDPDAFVRFAFRRLVEHRLPRYRAMAERWGVAVEASDVAEVRDPKDFDDLIADALERRRRG